MVCVIIGTGDVKRTPVIPPEWNFLLTLSGNVQWP